MPAMKWFMGFALLLLLTLAGPAFMATTSDVRLGSAWYAADRSSAGLAPAAATTPEAVVQIYAARAFSWRGLFAVHTWVATKRRDATGYTVHEVTGWARPALSSVSAVPDRRWFEATPVVLADLRGARAERAIEDIETELPLYPFARDYRIWPGPNSNTFTAWLIRRVPALNVALPSTAIGKDFIGRALVARVPSGSGYQLSLYGVLGVTLAREEGLELNLFGLVWGIDPFALAIKLPGIGRLSFRGGLEPSAETPAGPPSGRT
ncbi:DUF3750 domain-containing protein [Salinisphaera sp. T31B1]|uniref:DUF3750 domain-containing protein n=1 Tax=Salinisphaera sp. T31B1 TaxID=727963 RepID=UPI00333FAA31